MTGLSELSWIGGLVKAANPLQWWRVLSSLVSKQVMLRRPIAAEVTEASYQGTHPYKGEFDVDALICRVSIRNPSDIPNTIASVHLEADGRAPVYSADHRKGERGWDSLVPRGGGFSSVPSKDRWLQLPTELGPWGAEAAWIGFVFLEPGYKLTFAEARSWTAELVVTHVRGEPCRVPVQACTLPDLSPVDEPST